jgi:hypothetical protein
MRLGYGRPQTNVPGDVGRVRMNPLTKTGGSEGR